MLYFIKDGVPPDYSNDSIKLTIRKNPSIKSWNPFVEDVKFKLYLSPEIVNLKKYNGYYIEAKERDVHHLSVFTMPSIGFYNQSNNNGYSVKYNQISLLSLGIGYRYTPYKKSYEMSASLYYSAISSTSNQISRTGNSSVDIPGEYGGNLYGIYRPEVSQFSLFSGIDYESFSSFNLQYVLNNDVVVVDTNNIVYLTLGFDLHPNFMEKLSLRMSLSKSIFSNYSSANSSTTKVNISGIKYMLFINYMFNEKWSAGAMFKGHSFSGDNDLSIQRFGAGVTYTFF